MRAHRGLRGWSTSLTVRLTALATAATAVVLAVVLAGVLALFSRQLDVSVDEGLSARLGDLRGAVRDLGSSAVVSESLAQLTSGDVVVASSATLPSRAVLAAGVRCPAADRYGRRTLALSAEGDRVAVRVLTGCLDDGRAVTVAASLQTQREARERLLVLLSLAGPLLLLLVAGTVGRAVRAALQPVDLLTREAAQISGGQDAGRRLPVIGGDDEIARLAVTLDAMLSRLAVSFARERAFVDDASHELRTPIAVLRGEIELALSDLSDPAEVEQSLRAALAEAERLGLLVEDLLVLARRGVGPAGAQGLDVRELYDTTAHRLRRSTGLAITVDCPPDLRLLLDVGSAERLLVNLVTNAAAAGARTVALSARRDRQQVLLDVDDDGPGFPPAFLPVAFERFARADATRSRAGGTGLGLALVRSIAAEAGGTAAVANDGALGGARIRLRLPAA